MIWEKTHKSDLLRVNKDVLRKEYIQKNVKGNYIHEIYVERETELVSEKVCRKRKGVQRKKLIDVPCKSNSY